MLFQPSSSLWAAIWDDVYNGIIGGSGGGGGTQYLTDIWLYDNASYAIVPGISEPLIQVNMVENNGVASYDYLNLNGFLVLLAGPTTSSQPIISSNGNNFGYYDTIVPGELRILEPIVGKNATSIIGATSYVSNNFNIYLYNGSSMICSNADTAIDFREVSSNVTIGITNLGTITNSGNAAINFQNSGAKFNLNVGGTIPEGRGVSGSTGVGNIIGNIIGSNNGDTINIKTGSTVSGDINGGTGSNVLNYNGNGNNNLTRTINNFQINIPSDVMLNINSGGVVSKNNSSSNNLDNSGTLNIAGGTVSVPITNEVGASMDVSSGIVSGNNSVTNSGTINITGGTVSAPITNVNNITRAIINPTSNGGFLNVSSGTVSTPIINEINATINVSGGTVSGSGNLTNSGTVNVTGGTISAPIINEINATINASGGTFSGSGNLTNSGTVNMTGATVSLPIINNGSFNITDSTISTSIINNVTGVIDVNDKSVISGTKILTNNGVLNLNSGGLVSAPVNFGVNGGIINLFGGTITSKITGGTGISKQNEFINIFIDGTSSNILTQVQSVGNILVRTKNFTVNSKLQGVSYDFATESQSKVIVSSGGDISGGGCISNAGTLFIDGGTIGDQVAMGNVTNSGTMEVAGNVKIGNFNNGVNPMAGRGALASVGHIDIVVNNTGTNGGTVSGSAVNSSFNSENPPYESLPLEPIFTLGGDQITPVIFTPTTNHISIMKDNVSERTVNNDRLILMANNGTLSIASASIDSSVTLSGNGTAIITAVGPIDKLQDAVNALTFTPIFTENNKYGYANLTVILNNKDIFSYNTNSRSSSNSEDNGGFGTLNIASGNMIAKDVNNISGDINIVGGDLSAETVNTNIIKNVARQNIVVSGNGSIGKNKAFKEINNFGHLSVADTALINSPIIMHGTDSEPSSLTISGGTIEQPISGSDSISDLGIININGQFTTKKNINKIKTINVVKDQSVGDFVINNSIVGVSTVLNISQQAIVTINSDKGGSVTGSGVVINNAGTMNINGPVKNINTVLGAESQAIAKIDNVGLINVNSGKSYTVDLNNKTKDAVLNITGGKLTTTNAINNAGQIVLETNGVLNSSVDFVLDPLGKDTGIVNLAGGTINGKISSSTASNNVGTINVLNNFTYTSPNTIIEDIANINVKNASNFIINSKISELDSNFIIDSGTTAIISSTGSVTGSANITNNGTLIVSSRLINDAIGVNNTNKMGDVVNNGMIQAEGGNLYIKSFSNNLADSKLNINGSIIFSGNITNTIGSINITNGDFSSIDPANRSSLTNAINQVITVSKTGSLGYASSLGIINNLGIINIDGGKFVAGDFNNQIDSAQLNISAGKVVMAGINNSLGTIAISGGDLSSSLNSSRLNNAGNIDLIKTGTLGANNPFVEIVNSGTLNIGIKTIKTPIITNNLNGIININNDGSVADVTLKNSGIVNLNQGGLIDALLKFENSSGVLNLNGGNIKGVIGGAASNGKGTVNINADFVYNGIDNSIVNVENINVKLGNFSVNNVISKVNNAFYVEKNAIVTVNNGGNIKDFPVNSKIVNSGTLSVNAGGTIGVPIIFGTNGGVLNLAGGSATKPIGGADSSGAGTINLSNNFTYYDRNASISNIDYFNVNAETFNINQPITKVNSEFFVAANGNVNINSVGNISGNGIIKNAGVINVLGGTIDTVAGIMNVGKINVNNNVYVSGNIVNGSNSAVNVSSNVGSGVVEGIYAESIEQTVQNTNNLGTIIVNNGGTIDRVGATMLLNFGTVTVNAGGLIKVPVNFGSANSGILNLSGGTVTADIVGGDCGSGSGGTINLNADFTYNTANNIRNISNINVNSANFIMERSIVGVNSSFNTMAGSTTTINSSSMLTGSGSINNFGVVNLETGGTLGANTEFFQVLNNNGVIEVSKADTGGMVYATTINNNIGSALIVNTNGLINANTINQSEGAILNIAGGDVVGDIIGDASGNAIINISNDFNANNSISKVSINLNAGEFTISKPIMELNKNFTTLYGTKVFLTGDEGSIDGVGSINNRGIFLTNKAIRINNFINGGDVASIATTEMNLDPLSAYGNININVIPTDINLNFNNVELTATTPGTQTVQQNTQLTFSSDKKNTIAVSGLDNLGGTVILTAVHGILKLANVTGLTSVSGDNSRVVSISGPLTSLNNAIQGLIFTPDLNYVGTDAKIQIVVHNSKTATALSPAEYVSAVFNPAYTKPILNITGGTVKTISNITNISGEINISNDGDLSSDSSSTSNSTLINAANQVVNITNNGTIGANKKFGNVTNNGIINAGGGNLKLTDFTNNNSDAQLNITQGIVKTKNINNTLGTINISNGDLSSIDSSNPSVLVNYASQVVNILNTGTIGNSLNGALGAVNNSGIINAGGGNITIGDFTNNNLNAKLNITNGIVKTKNINNILGTINISNGDLSSVDSGNPSMLTNAANQVITVYNSGTIGNSPNGMLGVVNNNGIFNIFASTKTGNFNNNINALTNIGADFSVGVGNAFKNSGTVNMVARSNLLQGDYTIDATGVHVFNITQNDSGVLNLSQGSLNLIDGATIGIQHIGDVLVPDHQIYDVIIGSTNVPTITNIKTLLGSNKLVSYELSLNNNDVRVIAHRNLIEGITQAEGNLFGLPVAKVLDNLVKTGAVSGELRTAIARLDGLSDQEISNAVSQLAPDPNITPETVFTGTSLVLSAMAERTDLIARAGIANLQTGYSSGSMQSNNSLWLKGLGSNIRQQARENIVGYNANTVGFAFGLDDQVLEDCWLGLGFSSISTRVNSKIIPTKKTQINSKQITLYGSYSSVDYYIDSFVAMAFNKYKYIKNMKYNGLQQTATAEYNATQPSAKVATGYIIDVKNNFRVIPNLSLQYSVLRRNSYNETGAGSLSLQKVTHSNLEQLEGGVGMKFGLLYKESSDEVYNQDLHFMVLRDFKNTVQETKAEFSGGGGTFSIQGPTVDRTSYNIGATLQYVHNNVLQFTFNYDLKIKKRFKGHFGAFAVKYAF